MSNVSFFKQDFFFMIHTEIKICFSALFSSNDPGKVGDWKSIFTEEQDEYFKSVFKSKMENSALDFVWEEQDREETKSQDKWSQMS